MVSLGMVIRTNRFMETLSTPLLWQGIPCKASVVLVQTTGDRCESHAHVRLFKMSGEYLSGVSFSGSFCLSDAMLWVRQHSC